MSYWAQIEIVVYRYIRKRNCGQCLRGGIFHDVQLSCCRSYKQLRATWIDPIERIICTTCRWRFLRWFIETSIPPHLDDNLPGGERFAVVSIAIIFALLSCRFGIITNMHRVWPLNQMTSISAQDFNVFNSTNARVAVLTNYTIKTWIHQSLANLIVTPSR